MTGVEHYIEAERLLAKANCDTAAKAYCEEPDGANTMMLAAAQVHATLALADNVARIVDGGAR